MVPCQARFRYAYNPENGCSSYRDPTEAAVKLPSTSNAPDYNFAPTLNSFSALAGLEETSLISPRRSIPKVGPRWRYKQRKVCFKSRGQGTEFPKLLRAESIDKWCQRLTGLILEYAGAPTTEGQDNAKNSQRSASVPSCFASHTSYGLRSSPIGPVLPQRVPPHARTNWVPKVTLNSRIPAFTIDILSKRGFQAPWPISICAQQPRTNDSFACIATDTVRTLLTCQDRSFPRPCHMAYFGVTRVMPRLEDLADSAFSDLQCTKDWAKCKNFTIYKSPIPLLEPLSTFYSHQSGHLRTSSWAAGLTYFCRTSTNSVLMESLNRHRPTPVDAPPICLQQNCKARGEVFPFLSHPLGHSIPQSDNNRVLHPGTILTAGSMINEYRQSSLAQQIDSIFANRNPRAKRRLYSGSTKSAKYPWLEQGFEIPPIDLASVSISPVREEPHPSSEDPSQDIEPGRQWVCVSRQNEIRSYLSILSDTWHQRPSTPSDSISPVLDSIPVIIEQSVRPAESILEPYSLEIMEDIDGDSDIQSNEEYEVVQPNEDDGSLEEWEAIFPLSARTSYYESDGESLWEEDFEVGL